MKYLTFLLISGLLVPPGVQAHDAAHGAPAATAATPAPKLQATLRTLWHGHVDRTRQYALAVHANDARRSEAAASAVVANARQLADAVGSFYGAPAGERMLALLAGHWGAVKAMTDAGHGGNRAAGEAAMATLTQNAGEIAVFLSSANPYLPQDAVRGLLLAHGAHHAAQIEQLMRGDRAAEAKTWAAMQAHMDVIADAMAGALAKQFPGKVS
ncbi:hypothetical protein [Agrilutibacter solisilvae]|uniref:DUF305 domain-containing protein n=1 Tax=Agrilutibacter solisilvae TaxID=2763317 RepID=A0A974Y017_9GAMM|nr:hypothetical protein [Lysobacter solisilvae]QSX78917.1 hypothetical protein I8J32_003040 [Lysobacter solisilvae]